MSMRNSPALPLILLIGLAAVGYFTTQQPDAPAEAADNAISGRPVVVDGDTLRIGDERIRLHGIDAPEMDQTCGSTDIWHCGKQAREALKDHIAGRSVTCTGDSRDRYGRFIGVCRVGGEDLNAWMVREGWAMAYRKYSTDYVEEEQEAAARGLNMWTGEFVPPWEWRRSQQ